MCRAASLEEGFKSPYACLLRNHLALVILEIVVHLARDHFHVLSAGAGDEVLVLSKQLRLLQVFNLLDVWLRERVSDLPVLHWRLALRTLDQLRARSATRS
jgi:hypothetical protein